MTSSISGCAFVLLLRSSVALGELMGLSLEGGGVLHGNEQAPRSVSPLGAVTVRGVHRGAIADE